RAQREAPRMVRIDQFVAHRRHLGDDAEPAERIDALIDLKALAFDGLARRAMRAVASGNEVAVDAMLDTILLVGQVWPVAVEIVRLHVAVFIDRGAAGLRPPIHQVACHFGLAVDHDTLADEAVEIDAVVAARKCQVETVMRQAFTVHALAGTRLVEKLGHAFFEHAGAYAAKHIVLAYSFNDDGIDTGVGKKLTQQETGRPRADDRHLRSHLLSSRMAWLQHVYRKPSSV